MSLRAPRVLSRRNVTVFCGLAILLWLEPQQTRAEEANDELDAAGLTLFESKIRPVLVANCYKCHSAESGKTEGGLALDSRQGVRTGGDRGPAVVPGEPERSILLTAISHRDPDFRMPPQKDRLRASVIQDMRRWIKMGAPDPRRHSKPRDSATDLEAGRQFWAFQKPAHCTPPQVARPGWARSDLDLFVLARLESIGLRPSADAESGTLLRRLHFDLIGLPPSHADVLQFQQRVESAGVDSALEEEVDALLGSEHFGERWGRHWLDVVRFAESSGKEANISFPYAWRYRDYVIDCVNSDVPFDRFIVEQIAGDLLPFKSDSERARLLIATGFLAMGPKNLDEANPAQFLADIVDEQIDTVTRAVMASSVACARCHDHKFDPFSMQDYYALAGVFASTKTLFGTAISPANRVGGDPLVLPHLSSLRILHKGVSAKRVKQLKTQLAALKKEGAQGRAAVQKAIEAGEDPSGIFTLRDALRIFWRSGAIEGQLEKVDPSGKPLPLAMGVLDREQISDAALLKRGDINRAGDLVPRGFPEVVRLRRPPQIRSTQSGRLEFAQWLTQSDHPLTARVLVNRVWHHLLGAGIVRTVDNFGVTGELPSHPQLLDHLARQFVENGWSVKRLVREIALSHTYRQASTYHAASFQRDPDNRLLWRAAKRRLDAESIRDAMLAVSADLDTKRPPGSLVGRVIGDRPISLIGLDRRIPADLDGSVHRSVYLPVLRDRLPDVLDLFDFAEPSLVTGARETTNVPVQALYLMNSPFVQARADSLARRLLRAGDSREARIRQSFLLCFSREPEPDEFAQAMSFLRDHASTNDERVAEQGLVSYCQALLSTAEFRNVD